MHEAWLPREHPLYRPRHGGKQLTALLCALMFFVTPTLMWLFGGRPGEIENRSLTEFPSITDGWALFTDMPAWATDHLVFRADAIEAADAISRGVFGEPAPLEGGNSHSPGPLPGAPQKPPETEAGSPTSPETLPEESGYRRVIEGRDGWLYYGYDMIGKCKPSRPFTETFQRLDQLRDAVESSGRRFVAVIAPDKTTMVPAYLPDSYGGQDCAESASKQLWELASQRRYLIDLRSRLATEAARLGEPVYFPQDTHWTDEGSLALTEAVAERIRPGITRTWKRADAGWRTGRADLAGMLGRAAESRTRQYELRPDGKTDRTSGPVRDLPDHRVSPPLDSTINARTLMFGDSFIEMATRYLFAGFSDLTIGDTAAVIEQKDTALEALVDAEVVVVQAVERSVAASSMQVVHEEFIAQVQETMAQHPLR